MKTIYLRSLTRKHGNGGYLLVGVYLLARWLLKRTVFMFCLTAGVTSIIYVGWLGQNTNISPTVQYDVTDLGTLPDATECEAHGINSTGQAVGVCVFANGVRHAFVWQGGKVQDLSAGNGSSTAYAINNAGQIAGENEGSACLWRNGKPQSLGALPGYTSGSARAISNKGDIAGYSYHRPDVGLAFRWHRGTLSPIEPVGQDDDFTMAAGINDSSDVAGESVSEWGGTRAFVNVVGSRYAEPLPTLGGPNNVATAINNRDQIVGYSNHLRGDEAAYHAFCWQNSKVRDLGVLGGVRSTALAINDKG